MAIQQTPRKTQSIPVPSVKPLNGGPAACVAVLDTPENAAAYLPKLKLQAGLQWILVDSGRYLSDIIMASNLPIDMFVFDFTQNLTDRIKPYLRICENKRFADIPVLFLGNRETSKQLTQIIDRSIDKSILQPCDPHDLVAMMGNMMRRAERVSIKLKCWILLDDRLIEGYASDLSATGIQVAISDPILYPQIKLQVFLPDSQVFVQFMGRVRRKEKDGGQYRLGIQFTKYLEGPLDQLAKLVGLTQKDYENHFEAIKNER